MDTLIRFENVSKAFDGKTVLSEFSHAFARGMLTFIEGPSGRGKTTLLRLSCGLETPDEGSVVCAEGLRFSYVFQEDRLCENLSAAANVRLVCPDRRSRAPEELLEGLGIGDRAAVAVKKLSGGEKRRVALARALAAPSDVLLLDEPLTGLDDAAKELVLGFIKPFLAGKAVLWVTHGKDEHLAFSDYEILKLERSHMISEY